MLTTPFDVLKWRINRWLHDYHHRAQAKEKQVKRWRKFKARLAEELAKEEIYEMYAWSYRQVDRPTEHNDVWISILNHAHTIDNESHIFCHFTPVRALGSRLTDVQISGPGGSVIFGRRTYKEPLRK